MKGKAASRIFRVYQSTKKVIFWNYEDILLVDCKNEGPQTTRHIIIYSFYKQITTLYSCENIRNKTDHWRSFTARQCSIGEIMQAEIRKLLF